MNSFIQNLARTMAIIGGFVLLALIVITCLSVVGRSLNTIGHLDFVKDSLPFISLILTKFGPINGDFEIVEAGIAFAIFCFFPWCTLNRGHATVDIFTSGLPVKGSNFLTLFWEALFLVVMAVISWRLFVGTGDKIRYGETTLLLETPVWWGFAACTAAASIATVVVGYSVILRYREFIDPSRASTQTGSTGH